MNKSPESRKPWFAMGSLIALAAALSFGCETRVVGAKGIGASSSHPNTSEPSGNDPWSNQVMGKQGNDR